MNKINQNVRYFNKVKQEFESKGWDFSKVLGRSNPFTLVKNERSMARFKERVRKERSYNKEREKIEKEAQKIWSRIRAKGATRKAKKEKNIRQELKEQGYSKRSINKLLDMQQELGLSNNDLLNKNKVSSKVAKNLIESLVNEFEVTRNGKTQKIRGALSRFSEIPRIKEKLKQLEEMVKKDKKALHHSEFVLQRFLNEQIPLRYNEFKEKHGRYITPPEQFYVDIVDDLLHMYSKYVN